MSNTQFKDNGIYYRQWPAAEPKSVVMLVHGLGEHCERYGALAKALNMAGYALCALDLPSHGQSDGIRGHIDTFDDYQSAVSSLHSKVKEWYPSKDVFLLGHSMGGLVSTRFLLDHQNLFKGALLSGALIESPQAPPSWQIGIMKIISAVAPKTKMLELDGSAVSRDPNEVEKYMNDPLVSKDKLSARLLVEMFKTMYECKTRAAEITLPIRIMHGGSDVMTAPSGSKFLHENISSTDKEIEIYAGLFHEIFNEPEAETIYQDVIAWLDKH